MHRRTLSLVTVPCSTELAEARRLKAKTFPDENNLQTLVTEDGEISCPTVLSEFSVVVTDTQEYLPPQSDVADVGEVTANPIETADVSIVVIIGLSHLLGSVTGCTSHLLDSVTGYTSPC